MKKRLVRHLPYMEGSETEYDRLLRPNAELLLERLRAMQDWKPWMLLFRPKVPKSRSAWWFVARNAGSKLTLNIMVEFERVFGREAEVDDLI